jgi:hypothetical protein
MCQDILVLTDENYETVFSEKDLQKFFFNHVMTYTIEFLRDVYLCTIVPEVSEKSQENAMQSKYKVLLPFDSVNGRKKMSFKDDESVKGEKILSAKMLEKKNPFGLDIQMFISSDDGGKSVCIDMLDDNPNGKKTALLAFGNYFSINIPLALKYYLKKRWDNVKVK